MPYEVTQRVDYSVIKKVPFITSEQVAVTEYEKEPYHIEKKFPMTEWEKIPFGVTIDEPYVVELWEHYTAQIQVLYEETVVRELTDNVIEEYTVSQQVPFVVSNPTTHVDIQQEHYTSPTRSTITHKHDVLHDENFGVMPHEHSHDPHDDHTHAEEEAAEEY